MQKFGGGSRFLLQCLAFFISVMAYFIYRDYVSIQYGYLGFGFYDLSFVSLVFFSFLASLLVYFIPTKMDLPSDLMAVLMYVFLILPSATVPLYVVQQVDYWVYGWFVVIEVIVFLIVANLSSWRIYLIGDIFSNIQLKRADLILVLFSAVGFILVVSTFGVNVTEILNMTDVSDLYGVRTKSREVNQGVVGYILPWLSRVLVPYFFVVFLIEKKYYLMLPLIAIQFVLFSTTGHKSIFAALLIIPFFYMVFEKQNSALLFLKIILVFFTVSILFFYFLDVTFLVDIVFRRMFLVLGMLDGFYLEYYSVNPKEGYDSLNQLMGVSGNGVRSAYEIGSFYMGRDETSANVGLFAAAYAAYGFLTVIYESVLLIVFLVLLNWGAYYRQRLISMCVCVMPFMGLMDSQLFTVLITHGLFLAFLIVVFIAPRRSYAKV